MSFFSANVGKEPSARSGHSLFHILLVKTSYEEFSNVERIEKKIETNSIKPIIGFDREDMK